MSISSEAMNALKGGLSIQSAVRKKLNEHGTTGAALDSIAGEMSQFRTDAEYYIENDVLTDDIQDVRKKVNNIINDVSRICRDETGYSIKCVSRKGGYVYDAVLAPSKAKSEPVKSETPDFYDQLTDVLTNNCDIVLDMLTRIHGEDAGKMFVEALQRKKDKE